MKKYTFLIEIGTEELPLHAVRHIAKSFSDKISIILKKNKINYKTINLYSTSRRVALQILEIHSAIGNDDIMTYNDNIIKNQKNYTRIEEKNYRTDEHSSQLIIDTDRNQFIENIHFKEIFLKETLYNIIKVQLHKLQNFQFMRWNNAKLQFIRPVRTVTMLLNNKIISGRIFDINIDRVVLGHRFMGRKRIILGHANDYQHDLYKYGYVIADYNFRKETIRSEIQKVARKIDGFINFESSLLDEVTSIVEWPVVFIAKFKKKFLDIPVEILIHIMQYNKKYFPIYNINGKLLPYFIFVTNIITNNPKRIIVGNEEVINSCLTDAKFFVKVDRKKKLEEYLPILKKVIFQKEFGSLYTKSIFIKILSKWVATKINANEQNSERAGLLSQCDLVTKMVFEFPEMQGIIGMYYAKYHGENEEIALAQKEQYKPRFSCDTIPTTLVSCAVAISSKIHILTGMFGIGKFTQGHKDLFALRRSAIGILRIILEKNLQIDLKLLIQKSVSLYGNVLTNTTVVPDILNFMHNRLISLYKKYGYNINIIKSVLANQSTILDDFDKRIRALSYFKTLKEFSILLEINKRTSNILNNCISTNDGIIRKNLLKEPDEIKLLEIISTLDYECKFLLKIQKYKEVLIKLSETHIIVDNFFKNVKIFTHDENIRTNRINILKKLKTLYSCVADISLLN